MVETILYTLAFAATMGVFGYLMTDKLTRKGEIFDFIPRLQSRLFGVLEDESGFAYWLAKVTYYCAPCIAGFHSLWAYPLLAPTYSIVAHLSAVIWSIFIGQWLTKKL